MSATILPPVIRQRYFNANGIPLAGGKLYTYAAGTTTPQASYTDQGGGTPNANPIILDANGECNMWLDPTLAYKVVLQDASGVQQWSVDQVAGAGTSALPQWNSTTNYAQGEIAADASGFGLLYVSLQNNNIGNALSNVSYWRLINGNIRTVATNSTLLVTDEVVNSDSSAGDLLLTLPAIATTPIGKRITIKDVGTGGHYTKINGSVSDLIDNSTGTRVIGPRGYFNVFNGGTEWKVTSSSEKISCSLFMTADQVLAAIGDVIFDTKEFDTHGIYNTTTGVATIPAFGAGKYKVNLAGYNTAPGTIFALNKGGSDLRWIAQNAVGNSVGAGSTLISLAAGDLIKITTNQATTIRGISGGIQESSFSIERYSD